MARNHGSSIPAFTDYADGRGVQERRNLCIREGVHIYTPAVFLCIRTYRSRKRTRTMTMTMTRPRSSRRLRRRSRLPT